MEVALMRLFHDNKARLVPIIWSIFASALAVVPPLIKPGFPPNHEDDTFVLRTMVYAKHFQFGDLLPIWSASDNFGMGSPLPGLYHRLFYMVSGAIYAVTANSKVSIALTLIAFTSIGVYSVFLLLRSFDSTVFVSLIGASVLPFLNYSVTNWLVRGAMAEYSAMMLIPLFLYVVKRSIDRSLLYGRIGLVMGFIFLAHSVIAYFTALLTGFILIGCCLLGLSTWKMFPLKKVFYAALGFFAVTWWSLLPMLYLRQRYDMSRLLPDFLAVRFQFRRITEYFWDSSWSWSNPPQLFTVQLDIVIVMSVILLLIMKKYDRRELWVIGLLIVTMVFQYGGSWRLYEYIPGAKYIQFPWRLLALASTLFVLLAFIGLRKSKVAVSIVALSTILLSGTWQRVNYYNYPDRLEVRNSRTLSAYSLSLFGEYLPADAALLEPDPSSSAVFSEWKNQIDTFLNTFNNSKNCQVNRVSPIAEIKLIEFTTRCVQDSVVLLPIFATDAHATKSTHSGFQKNCIVEKRYQSLCAVSVPSGFTSVDVQIPSITQVFSKTLTP